MADERWSFRVGGLMRCCVDTLHEFAANAAEDRVVAEGDTLYCRHEPGASPRIIFRDGAWEWNQSEEVGHPLNEPPSFSDSPIVIAARAEQG